MNRNVVLYIAMSLDGYIATEEESLAWLFRVEGEKDNGYSEFYNTVDTIIMGRKTYDWIMKEEKGRFPYEGKKCYVFSRSAHAPDEHVAFVTCDIIDFVKTMKSAEDIHCDAADQDGKGIWIVGGGELIAPLVRANVVDEYIINVAPVLIGSGIPLFTRQDVEVELTLKSIRQFNQFAELHYVKNRKCGHGNGDERGGADMEMNMMVNMEIRKLTPALVEDYLRFFDQTPHSTNLDEHRCYCVCWSSDDDRAYDFSTAEKRRAMATTLVNGGRIQGYLAYQADQVVGWCNANTKSDCYECCSWRMFMGAFPRETDRPEKRVKSVFCFAIAPHLRGKGVAGALLRQVCEDAEKDGFDAVEAYPNKAFVDTEQDFMGPVALYEKHGFQVAHEVDQKLVMRKALR